MAKKVVTFGEIMLRLAPEGYYRFVQADTLGATLAVVRQTLQFPLQTMVWMQNLFQNFLHMRLVRLL